MAGRLSNLSESSTPIPPDLVLDSSVVINWLTAIVWPNVSFPPSPLQFGAARLVTRLGRGRGAGLVTPTVLNEVFHVVLKIGYRAAIPEHQADLVARYPNARRHDWSHLFKARSDLVESIAADLHRVRSLMRGNRLLVLQPDDLGPIPSGRALDDELVHTMARYGFDSNDAAILIEARRAGVGAIASADDDFQRAQRDVDVYTWL